MADRPNLFRRLVGAFRGTDTVQASRRVPLQLSTSVLGENGELRISLPDRRGGDAGMLDPNPKFTPEFLYGTKTTPGALMTIRVSDPVVQPAADSRRELLQSLEYDVVPPKRLARDTHAIACAAAVNTLLNTMPDRTLSFWVGETYDWWSTIGHYLAEIVADGDKVSFLYVRRGLLDQWIQDKETGGYRWSHARVETSRRTVSLPAEKCAYFARNPVPGQYDGNSAYRCVVAPSATTTELYRNLLEAMKWSRGTLHIQGEKGEYGGPTLADAENIKEFTDYLYNSDEMPGALVTTSQVKASVIASNVAALQQFAPLAQYQDEAKNRAALNALNNLGMRGVGSRSLGEVVHEVDQAHLRAHLDAFLDILSGDNHPNGTMMRTLAQLVGFEPEYAPRIVVRWTDRTRKMGREHLQMVTDLVADKMLRNTPEMSRFIATQAQLPEDVINSQFAGVDESETIEPLQAGSLNASIAILQALNPPPGSGVARIAPKAAVSLLVAAGVPSDQAQAMVNAQSGIEAPEPADGVEAADSFTPPKTVQSNARRGLELRKEHGRGGTEVGVARARDLSNGRNVSRETIARMRSFFARHDANAESREDDPTSAANIAWLLWGGDAGKRWVESDKFDRLFEG